MKTKPTLGQALVMGGGVLMFIWGFLNWYSDHGSGVSAWSGNSIPGLFPIATWVALVSLAMAILIAIRVFGHGLPEQLWGFSWLQLSLIVGIYDTLTTFGFLVANKHGASIGIGLILSFLMALVILAGAILEKLGVGAEVFKGQASPPPPVAPPPTV